MKHNTVKTHRQAAPFFPNSLLKIEGAPYLSYKRSTNDLLVVSQERLTNKYQKKINQLSKFVIKMFLLLNS